MKKLEFLVIHCTATPQGRAVTSKQIREWHTTPAPKGRGWKQVGYTDMIHLNGLLENLVPHNDDEWVDPREITNGAVGINSVSRHVVYVGGMDEDNKRHMDTRTPEQKLALTNYIKHVISRHPDIKIGGHNQFAVKACPSFDVPKWLRAIGIAEKNICDKPLMFQV
jgi:N-acetylmuramoyl-L-alanine amidase